MALMRRRRRGYMSRTSLVGCLSKETIGHEPAGIVENVEAKWPHLEVFRVEMRNFNDCGGNDE